MWIVAKRACQRCVPERSIWYVRRNVICVWRFAIIEMSASVWASPFEAAEDMTFDDALQPLQVTWDWNEIEIGNETSKRYVAKKHNQEGIFIIFLDFFPRFPWFRYKNRFSYHFHIFSGHASEGEERIFTPKVFFLIKLIIVWCRLPTLSKGSLIPWRGC